METGELINLEFDDTTRIAVLGSTGSGKTVGSKAILSRIHDDGWNVVHFSDVKHDFQDISYKGGASQKLIDETAGLAKGEEPHSVPKKIFQPKFLYDEYDVELGDAKPTYVEPFTLGFRDIEESDFKSLVGVTSKSQTQTLNNLLSNIDLKNQTFSTIKSELEDMNIEFSGVEGALKRSFESLENDNLISSRYRKDPFQYVVSWRCHDCEEYVFKDNKGKHSDHDLEERRAVLSLGLENYDNYEHEKEKYQFYVASMMHNFIQALRRGQIEGPYVVFCDEYHELAPRDEDSPVKSRFQRILDVSGRQNEIATLISTQRPSQIPWPKDNTKYDFIGDLDHIFIAEGLGPDEWRDALNSFNFFDSSHEQPWKDKISSMDEYQFLYVNTNKDIDGPEDCPVVEFLAPKWTHTG